MVVEFLCSLIPAFQSGLSEFEAGSCRAATTPRSRRTLTSLALTSAVVLASAGVAQAQSGEWTYQFGLQGGTTSAAYFGTEGVSSIFNNPGAREGAITWNDAGGNLWMFGGYGDSSDYIGYLNDLWMWNTSTKQWTWMGGPGPVMPPNYANPGVYGTQAVASSTNIPGGRVAAQSWIDSSGKVWLYGGQGADSNGTVGTLSDLWRYDPVTQQWTWISGSSTNPGILRGNPAVYGTLGVAATANTPGARDGATTWVDASGNLWLFGGLGSNATLSDLWRYSPTSDEWTWMGGSSSTSSAGSLGLPGVPSATAFPSPRYGALGWVDSQKNFWLFGGNVGGGNAATATNDLWEFNPTTNQWTFWNGSMTPGGAGSFGTQGVAAASNVPPNRGYGSAWTDANGNLWMFGGTQALLVNNLNDLWLYSPSANEWTWMGGSQTIQSGGTYGPQGTPTPTAYPGARDAQMTWVDLSGNVWIFAGWQSEPFDYQTAQATPLYWNDLWEYATPSIKAPAVTASPLGLTMRIIEGTSSAPQSVTLTNSGSSSISISSVAVSGANASVYQLSNGCGATLAAGSSCSVGVVFSSSTTGLLPATLVFTDSDASSPQSVSLNGFSLTATTAALSGNSSTLTTDSSDTLTVTVLPVSGTGTPTGTVKLLSGSTTVATLTLGSTGTASYTIPNPAIGSTMYTAQYSGDANYGASNANSFTVTYIANPTTSAPVWAWLNGASTELVPPVPVSAHPNDPAGMGVASTSNYPGVRYDSLTWSDQSGNLYLFGGIGFDDLWKYNIASSAWTLLKGTFNLGATLTNGVFGTKGTPAAANMPGSRSESVSWKDASGNLWLFGGEGPDANGNFGPLNDLWMYSPATNNWTWMGGDQTLVSAGNGQAGVYGTKGTAAAANRPGGRYEAVSWSDKNGNLWLFGGAGEDASGTLGSLNDLWMYNTTTNQWTWEAGGSSSNFQVDIFGTQGLAAPGNTPSARQNPMSWVDANGKLWLFGGSGYGTSSGSAGDLNDLWKFDPSSLLWTYVSGTLTPESAGTYGTLGIGSTKNVPPARQWGATFTDTSGNLWLFGGTQITYGSNTETVTPFNDLWMYSPAQNIWTWVAGSNTSSSAGNYGTEGTASTANIPSARFALAAWTDNAGNFWLLGGTNEQPYGGPLTAYDDLWEATPAVAAAPQITLSATQLTFASQPNTTSAAQTVTITNSGSAPLSLGGFVISGTNQTSFADTTTCGSSLGVGASCTVSVTFSPNATGSFGALLSVDDSAGNSPQTVALSGTGTGTVAPIATIYPTSLTFSPTLVNTTNSGRSITLANSGTAALTGITASITGANASSFAVATNTCSSLGLGGTCTISVTFTPAATGTFNAALSIADNAGNSPQAVPLSGSATAAQELASITPSLLAFANQPVNTASGPVTVTLANVGSTALTGISPAITGAGVSAFAIPVSTCGTSLAAGASCSLSITFTPNSTTTFNATLTVADDASNAPQLVPLSGTGIAASATSTATLSTTSLTFPNTAIGASSPLSVTVTNSGTQPLSVEGVITGDTYYDENSGLSAPGDVFAQTSTCGSTLAVGASCVITVTFTPSAGVPYSGTLLIADTSSSFAQAVALAGVGTGGSGVSVAMEPTPLLNFGTVALNTTSAPMTATLTNTGSVTLTGITPSLSGSYASDYAISATTCGSSLAPSASCTISLTYTSAATGQYGATLAVADSAPGSPQQISLYGGTGCPSASVTICNPGGSRVVTSTYGVALAFQPATVTTATATAASTEIIGKYQGTVVYDQTFPAAYGTPTVQAAVTAANAAIVVAGGSGAVIPAPALTSSSTTTSTASTSVYSRDPAAPVTTRESATTFGPATIYASLAPTEGQLTECTEASLPSSTMPTCYATDPGVFQVLAGQQDININSTLSYLIDTATTTTTTTTTSAAYAINATAPTTLALSVTPVGPLTFSTASGTTSAAQTVTITNSGTASLSISGISISGTNASSFAQTTNCGGSLAVNASCTASVTFSPSAAGSFTATLSIADNATGSPQSITLNGTGTAPAPVATTTSLSAGANSIVVGTSETLSATVKKTTGSAVPTGTVTFYNGATSLGTAALNGSGVATYATSSLGVGAPSLTASYGGDTGDSPSVSAPVVVTVTAPPTPAVTLTPAGPLSFTAISGSTSTAQLVTLTNTGNSALSISSISITGSNASSFAQTTTCGSSLTANASCSITITFAPASVTSFTASLTVSDNASGSPQTLVLNGTGTTAPSFTISALTQSSTASPGAVATYQLTVTPQNGSFTNPVSFSASGVPSGYIATFSPATVTPGNAPVTATLTISKGLTGLLHRDFPWTVGPALACLPFLFFGMTRRRRALTALVLALASVATFALSGCGGGFGLPSVTYNVTITATGSGESQSTTVPLTVQQ